MPNLIDYTFFIGTINVPNTNQPAVQGLLTTLITKYQEKLLTDLLGRKMYLAFMDGIQAPVVEAKWQELLTGADYVDMYGRDQRWMGIAPVSTDIIQQIYDGLAIDVVVGRGQTWDPVADQSVCTIPTPLQGKAFSLEQRVTGTLRPDEYTINAPANTAITLTGGKKFTLSDTYFFKGIKSSFAPVSGTERRSLIANFVYYWYQRTKASETSGTGESITKTENAARTSPADKMTAAWNEMAVWVKEMILFLRSKDDVYTDFLIQYMNPQYIRPINSFNI
jgi:hypothetical protein